MFKAECLEHDEAHPQKCGGEVLYRMSLSPSGEMFPRCDMHWEKRYEDQMGIVERYPDTPFAPADFDPTYAGERWDEE